MGRKQGLEQRARVVVENIIHLTSRQARLDEIINAAAVDRWYFDFEGHIGVKRGICVGESVDHQLIVLI